MRQLFSALPLLVACLALGTNGRSLTQLAPNLTASPTADPLSPVADSTSAPFSWVGQLANGCTAFLVGPCHALTVAHCVYDPHRDIWWPGVELFPGRCVQYHDVCVCKQGLSADKQSARKRKPSSAEPAYAGS